MPKAGVARCTITPPTGMTMAGYGGREGTAEDKDGELFATALVLDDERARIVIVTFDLIFIEKSLVSDLRERIGKRIGVPEQHVLLNCSHTHCGPTSNQLRYDDDEFQDQLRHAYATRLLIEIPALAYLASHRARPVRIGTGVGEARIGINRREVQPDGSILLGENPKGPVDHEVRVIRVDDLEGRPIAVVFAHGCHPVTMGPKCLKWSADFVGPARELIEQNVGCLSLFLQASAGDINPITGIGADEDNTNEKKRLGFTLGAEVVKVHSSIYTESIRGPRVLIGSLSKIPYYRRIPLKGDSPCTIKVREEMLELCLQDLPNLDEAKQILGGYESEISTLLKNNVSGAPLNVARLFRHWALVLNDYVANARKPAIQIPIQAIKLGDLGIVTVPGETFSLQGMEVKRRSPFANTLFLGYTNGCVSYIPTRDAYPARGWSVTERYYVPEMSFQAFPIPTALAVDSGERIVSKSLDLLRQVHL
jgi:neutral ceramidase